MPYKIPVHNLRQDFTGINSFRKAKIKIGIDQKTVFKKYKKRDKTPRTGLGKTRSII